MPSPTSEDAANSALQYGSALLKYISPNDVGLTGSHQCGFYLPKSAWQMYSVQPPEKGVLAKHPVRIEWQDGRITKSVVTWYGKLTRSEFRLTRFGHDFPFLTPDEVGSLLVIVPRAQDDFLAYVLDLEDDIADVQAKLGVEVIDTWGVYRRDLLPPLETQNECIDREFREFASAVSEFPTGLRFALGTRDTLEKCISDFAELPSDDRLMRCVEQEYMLFKLVERKLCEPEVCRVFKSVDDFLGTANSILQRRKSRAGQSLEHHVEDVLKSAGIPFERQPKTVDGQPDIIIPGAQEYNDSKWPDEKLFMVGIKRTCKDRWRQVTKEAKRLKQRHILTIQQGISQSQLKEMRAARVSLVVPQELHAKYPPEWSGRLLTVERFVGDLRKALI
jgi:hypothetical protein